LKFGFCVGIYTVGISHLYRYDGMCIKAHPVMAAIIADVIREQPFRLPIVPDKRNQLHEVEIIDMSSTGIAVVRFEGLAIPTGCEELQDKCPT
jgi:hypothetical protein